MEISYQNTYNGLSVARFSLHSNLSVDPSFICKSGASIISATASVVEKEQARERKSLAMRQWKLILFYFVELEDGFVSTRPIV